MKYISILALALLLSVCSTSKNVKEEFTVDHNSPKITAGTIEVQFDKLIKITGLRQVEITVEYYPMEDAVCLQYRLDFMTYHQFWSRDGRAAYSKALEQYKEDFEQKALSLKGGKKSRIKYGRTIGYLIWQAFSYTERAYAKVNIDLGYDIKEISKNKAAFFTLYQREALFTNDTAKDGSSKSTLDILMYLSRAKADELAVFFDQDFLDNLISESMKLKNNNPSLDTL